jgi:hypothetical protein
MVVPDLKPDSHALLTRPPLAPKSPFDLHVLSIPPAFILSQDQTLRFGLFRVCGSEKKFPGILVINFDYLPGIYPRTKSFDEDWLFLSFQSIIFLRFSCRWRFFRFPT